MKALIIYVVLVVAGAVVAGFVGVTVENAVSPALALIVFLTMFFANFFVCWLLTVLIMDGTLKAARG